MTIAIGSSQDPALQPAAAAARPVDAGLAAARQADAEREAVQEAADAKGQLVDRNA